ncbi:hypothetical protein DZC41_15735 [Acinetobacter haemolyticus]|uniref:hypothetical protein n=1 Tax=Acinetobacter haemolyticus TaxID=29430 RepID=UPI0013875FC8|nr:hypothetical protein [Acinetobacter haemolyticus]NCU24856.1 hypothetical protein [Acinetobacter haemolyticus]
MKFTTDVVITGAKSYNNTIDGVPHNFTKLFVMTDLSDQSGVGQATVEYKWGTSDNYKKIQDKDFPFTAKAAMEIVTTGTRQSTIVHDITPVAAPPSK